MYNLHEVYNSGVSQPLFQSTLLPSQIITHKLLALLILLMD